MSENFQDGVDWFAGRMARKLSQSRNLAKPHWNGMTFDQLMLRVRDELIELELARWGDGGIDVVIDECADVANFLMMIADNANRKGHCG